MSSQEMLDLVRAYREDLENMLDILDKLHGTEHSVGHEEYDDVFQINIWISKEEENGEGIHL